MQQHQIFFLNACSSSVIAAPIVCCIRVVCVARIERILFYSLCWACLSDSQIMFL